MSAHEWFLVITGSIVAAVHGVPWLWHTLRKPLIPSDPSCYMDDYHDHMFDRARR